MRVWSTGGVAAGVFVWSACAARTGSVGAGEERIFRWFNRSPDGIRAPAWVVMQAGSLGGVFAIGGATGLLAGSRPAGRVIGVGTAVWLLMKLVKPLVGRGRPADLLDGVTVRGRPQTGLGYPSGHAAVSTTIALAAAPSSPLRMAGLAVAAAAGTSRMYVGAHLPLDVAGGYAAGALAGSVAACALSPSEPAVGSSASPGRSPRSSRRSRPGR